MTFTTERLTIRELCADDWQTVKRIWGDFDRSPYAKFDAPHATDDEDIKRLVKQFSETGDFFLVSLTETNAAIGVIDVHNT